MKYNKTSIIIVTYKALDHIKACLQSIRSLTSVPYELIIIDNDSGPEVVNYLKEQNNLKLILNKKNVLLTPAQNQGLGLISNDSKYILFLNPDTKFLRNDWLELLIDRLESEPHFGIVGPICNYFPIKPLLGNIDMACLLVRRHVLDEVKGLDNKYPWNGAGLVLTAAAWEKGWRYSHLKKPKIVTHFKSKSRAHNWIPNQKINMNDIFKKYNLKPNWSIWGLINQLINRPEIIWKNLRKKF